VLVVVDGDAGERCERLALRAGAQAQDLGRLVVPHIGVAYLRSGRDAEVAEPLGDLRRLLHAAPEERDLAIKLLRQLRQELQPIDAARKCGDDNLPLRTAEDFYECADDLALGSGEAATVGVGAV